MDKNLNHNNWNGIVCDFKFISDEIQSIDCSLSKVALSQALDDIKKALPNLGAHSKSIMLSIEVSTLANALLSQLKNNTSNYGQVERHLVVDLWSEDLALRSFIDDLIGEINQRGGLVTSLTVKELALLSSAESLLNHITLITLRFLNLERISSLIQSAQKNLCHAQESLGNFRYSNETTLPL